jgi:hypothetical protein
MLGELGEEYVNKLRKCYDGRVPGGADLVTYWFEKARAQVEAGKSFLAGFVATQAIRAGSNRKVLERICASGRICNAWSDESWINDGAAVRVSLVCFMEKQGNAANLNGQHVSAINADLTIGGYPKRPAAKPGHKADLKKRTFTNLYNTRPAWLDNAHRTLDKAVAAAYGWNDYTPEMADETILGRLLALNVERAAI